jgi:eukaryotic-like serine/threonine-protein kinase
MIGTIHPDVGLVINNKYTLVEHLGSGGFGEVFRAESTDGSKKSFAIKIINPYRTATTIKERQFIDKNLDRYQSDAENESYVINQLHSRHVLTVYKPEDLDRTGKYCIIMNYCSGGSMLKYNEQVIEGQKLTFRRLPKGVKMSGIVVPEDLMRVYMRQIASVFEYYNHVEIKHLIHRDIKLDNIFIDGDNAVIGDFGLASVGFPKNGKTGGTSGYIAPEIAQGKESIAGSPCRLQRPGIQRILRRYRS